MLTIVFETHATSLDNEASRSSGHDDVDLSPRGVEQARELGRRRSTEVFDAVLCSDLRRSWRTAEIAFGDRLPILKDVRLRECDYGTLTGQPRGVIEAQALSRVDEPFPGGESYRQAAARVRQAVGELHQRYAGGRVLLIGHRATHYGLEHLASGRPLEAVVTSPWSWQPGWTYELGPQ